MDEESKTGLRILGLTIASFVAGLSMQSVASDITSQTKIYPRENKPSVMRTYRMGPDFLGVEDPKQPGNYIQMYDYLETIRDKDERAFEEADIKRAARWASE